jgi:dynein heavy chain
MPIVRLTCSLYLTCRSRFSFNFENKSVCEEYEKIKVKATKRPETTEELNELQRFVDLAKSLGVTNLLAHIREIQRAMVFLLNNHTFDEEDIDLNTQVLLWPHEINPIFDYNDQLVAEVRTINEAILIQKREKLIIELDKISKRIDEFADYGELEMMREYVDDVKLVQKRIVDAEILIEWIKKVQTEFGLHLVSKLTLKIISRKRNSSR